MACFGRRLRLAGGEFAIYCVKYDGAINVHDELGAIGVNRPNHHATAATDVRVRQGGEAPRAILVQ